MADGNGSNKSHRSQETFQRAQETNTERKLPNPIGVVPLPHGSRGPKSLYLRRSGDSFGFTLRHFIVYPPDSVADNDGRHAAIGALSAPMDTIFVKNVKDRGPAKLAGLQRGDRLIRVNQVLATDKTYAQVVQLIQNSPDHLHLLVVPKEDDILQRYFSETAYNPATNQHLNEHQTAQTFLAQTFNHPPEFQVDAISWRSLQNSYGGDSNNDEVRRQRPRAEPQVPLHKKMGRRASDGCALSDREYYTDPETMKTLPKSQYLPEAARTEMPALRYPNSAGCRLSLDAGRRESSSSLTSSIADGSKDSLTSYDSTSTLTGHDTDDSIMSRYRKNFQQKEEFLKMTPDATLLQREFYGRPKKLERAVWPPNEPNGKGGKPSHQNLQRVRTDIESERELTGLPNTPLQKGVKSPKQKQVLEQQLREGSVAPEFNDSKPVNGSYAEYDDEKKSYGHGIQMVHRRARQFESGKPMPEDDPIVSNRTDFHRSELARLSSKKVVPNVCERAQEYETRSNSEPRRESPKKIHRDSRSLESNGSSSSTASISDTIANRLSGNVIISTGSKYIHCPPPSEYGKPTDAEYAALDSRARSNSIESWVAALKTEKKIARQDAALREPTKDPMEIPYADLPPLIPESVEHMLFAPSVSVTPAPDVPKAVRPNQLDLEGPIRPARHLKPPTASVDTPLGRPVSPVIGDDNRPVVVKRRTKNTNIADDERVARRESYLKATEVGRMHFDTELSDGDLSPHVIRSAHRRWRPPLFPGDIQQLRKLFEDAASSLGGSVSGNSSSSASLDREKSSPLDKNVIIREGSFHCKITEIDGKRFGDRSWKQTWGILKGPKLYLYKNHQSPMGAPESLEQSLSSGVDLRSSEVRIAEDYTKRKHVLRVSSVNPCRSEFLLQADNTDEFTDWYKCLQDQMATNTDAENKIDLSGSKQQAVPQTVPASTSILTQSSRLSPQFSKSKSSSRNRSPTGQSPVSKTRKPSQVDPTSPKAKTWRTRVAKQFLKKHGANSPNSPTAPEGSTFGAPLEQCLPSTNNPFVPKFVEICTDIVDAKGLQTVGIYRVPGNSASITALTEEINRHYDSIPLEDPKWNDLHVVSSLLKAFLRKIPESLVTNSLYPLFIKADKIDNPQERLKELKRLVTVLPPHHYHTLRHIIFHLKKVVDNAHINKMEAKNLAIVFGPNIVKPEEENVESMVNNMTHQCKIVETFLAVCDWMFSEPDLPVPEIVPDVHEDTESAASQTLLLDNISKYEALKEKEKNGALLFSSIISAAQRKVKRKTKGSSSLSESKEEVTFSHSDLKDSTTPKPNNIPTTVSEIEKTTKPSGKGAWFNYSTDTEDFHRRIKNFRQETEAMLQMPRNLEISVNNIGGARLSKPSDSHLLKTNSASNVFTRSVNVDNRHSLDNSYQVQYKNSESDFNKNRTVEQKSGRHLTRRGSSVENLNTNSVDLNANGALKKVKYETEGELNQRMGSLDSLNRMASLDDDADLVTTLTTLYDKKLLEKKTSKEDLLAGEDFPYVDESPEKSQRILLNSDKENVPNISEVYRNPSLHKNQQQVFRDGLLKESHIESEKEEDSTQVLDKHKINSKLKRSESLTKDRTVSPLSHKLKRSESLTKNSEKLKRSDSLTKTEKTESNLNKRREVALSMRRAKDVKLKRKNGMPDRSIKRRHTVGGTKDPDKVTWLDNKDTCNKENHRTSSPDLSSMRRERLYFEVSLLGPENMVLALKQHFMGTRPQSFPDTTVYKVLESHV